MKSKSLILAVVFLSVITIAFGQDSSLVPALDPNKNNKGIINSAVDPNTTITDPNSATGAPHSDISPNTGTGIPATTSGTLNSTVNPSTQLVIPLHKSKKNGGSNATPGRNIVNTSDSSVSIPKNK